MLSPRYAVPANAGNVLRACVGGRPPSGDQAKAEYEVHSPLGEENDGVGYRSSITTELPDVYGAGTATPAPKASETLERLISGEIYVHQTKQAPRGNTCMPGHILRTPGIE